MLQISWVTHTWLFILVLFLCAGLARGWFLYHAGSLARRTSCPAAGAGGRSESELRLSPALPDNQYSKNLFRNRVISAFIHPYDESY